jgi:hypothetical protein
MIQNFIKFLFFLSLITGLNAQSVDSGPNTGGAAIATCIILMIVGLVFLFAGKKIIKIIIALHGFILFAGLTFIIASAITHNFENTSRGGAIGVIVAAVIIGVLGAMLSWCLYKVGVFLLGAAVGALIGNIIVQFFNQPPLWLHLTIVIILALIMGCLTIFFLKLFIILTTSWQGANYFMIGVDTVANKGFAELTKSLADGNNRTWTGSLIAMVVSTFLIALLGALVQFKVFGTSESGLEEKKNGDYNAVNTGNGYPQ